MMGLRKFFVLSAALALALIGSGTALGQLCQVASGGAGRQVRAEGLSEQVDDIVVVCTPGIIEATTRVKITVTLSDGVVITNPVNNTDDKVVNTIYATQYVTTTEFTDTSPTARTPDQDATTKLTGGGSTVEMEIDTWRVVPSATDSLRLKISNIHINAAAVGVGNTVKATVTVSNLLLFGNTTANVARPVVGLKSSLVGYMTDNDSTLGNGSTVNEPVQGLACAASKKTNDDMLDDDEDAMIARIEVKEGFATAFKSSVRIRLSFNDIPAGVDAYLRPRPNCSFEAGGTGHKRISSSADPPVITYEANADGDAGAAAQYLELNLMSGLDSNGGGTGAAAEGNDDDYVKVNLSGGSGVGVYEVNINADGGSGVDNCEIPIAFVWTGGVELGSGTVSASFAPLSTVGTAATIDAMSPRFATTASGSAIEVIRVEDCSTTLLFPFVTNQADYDTGIVISNTSQDEFGTTENAGACTIYFYGSMMGGGAAPDAYTSDSIAAGEQFLVQLSSEAAGFQGYLMARCSFQFAHGLAFLTNGAAGGAPTLGQSYLALVVPARQGSRGVGGGGFEQLNN